MAAYHWLCGSTINPFGNKGEYLSRARHVANHTHQTQVLFQGNQLIVGKAVAEIARLHGKSMPLAVVP